MKTREAWIDEARLFIENWTQTSEEPITLEVVLIETRDGWSEDVNYDGTPEEYAEELFEYIKEENEEGESMKEYTIRSNEDGAVIMTGYRAESASEALAEFYADYPVYEEGEAYAVESNWND